MGLNPGLLRLEEWGQKPPPTFRRLHQPPREGFCTHRTFPPPAFFLRPTPPRSLTDPLQAPFLCTSHTDSPLLSRGEGAISASPSTCHPLPCFAPGSSPETGSEGPSDSFVFGSLDSRRHNSCLSPRRRCPDPSTRRLLSGPRFTSVGVKTCLRGSAREHRPPPPRPAGGTKMQDCRGVGDRGRFARRVRSGGRV